MASLPHVLGDKETQRNKSGELFWQVVDVSLFSCIFSILLIKGIVTTCVSVL